MFSSGIAYTTLTHIEFQQRFRVSTGKKKVRKRKEEVSKSGFSSVYNKKCNVECVIRDALKKTLFFLCHIYLSENEVKGQQFFLDVINDVIQDVCVHEIGSKKLVPYYANTK